MLRPRLGSVRLVELERQFLGMWREDDISGALIPQLYFDYLDGGEVSPIAKVIEHNANDLIALAALLAKLVSHFDEVHGGDDPRDHLAYAKVAERTGDRQRASSFAHAAAEGGGEASCVVEACLLSARIARRHADVDEEERRLLMALEAADEDQLHAAVQLALNARSSTPPTRPLPRENRQAHEGSQGWNAVSVDVRSAVGCGRSPIRSGLRPRSWSSPSSR